MVAVGGRGRGVDLIPKALRLKGLVENESQYGPSTNWAMYRPQAVSVSGRTLQKSPVISQDSRRLPHQRNSWLNICHITVNVIIRSNRVKAGCGTQQTLVRTH